MREPIIFPWEGALLKSIHPCAGAVLVFLSRAAPDPAGADEHATAEDADHGISYRPCSKGPKLLQNFDRSHARDWQSSGNRLGRRGYSSP